MALYILKSSTCLAIFFLFYKLFLENERMHLFKRFYLLIALVIAFIIPLITFTSYVSVTPMDEFIVPVVDNTGVIIQDNIQSIEPIENANYIPIILWTAYTLGVLYFAIKFIVNLSNIVTKIRKNPNYKFKNFINVLLQGFTTPHTFFNYIFLNKSKFEKKEIPQEVLLHEQAHANQKHSIDILLIEVFRIVFWFNPFIYFISHAVKLNHEFLADEAVLHNGAQAAKYQKILLNYTSNDRQVSLANAINYSFIKKRFTIMKTQTSKRAIWIRTLVMLPLLTMLIYGFSNKVVIEKLTPQIQDKQQNEQFSDITSEIDDINNSQLNYSEIATPEQIAEYNKLAKYYNAMSKENMVVKKIDVERISYLYSLMTKEQKENAESFPVFPPPPSTKILKSNTNKNIILLEHWYITIDGKRLYYPYKKGDLKKYYDKFGTEVHFDIVKKYQKKNVEYENFKNTGKHYIHKSTAKKKELEQLASDLGGMYFRMSRSNKAKVKKPKKIYAPYLKMTKKNGEVYYKKREELTNEDKKLVPPPPPLPKNPTQQQEETVKKAVHNYDQEIDNIVTDANTKEDMQLLDVAVLYDENVGEKIENKVLLTQSTTQQIDTTNTGWTTINNQTYYYHTKDGKKEYYNRNGNRVDENGKIFLKRTDGLTRAYGNYLWYSNFKGTARYFSFGMRKLGKNISYKNMSGKETNQNGKLLDPQPVLNPSDLTQKGYIRVMMFRKAKFYYNDKFISIRRAQKLVRNKKISAITCENSNVKNPIVKLFS